MGSIIDMFKRFKKGFNSMGADNENANEENKNLGAVQPPSDGSTSAPLDTPDSDEPKADAAAAPENQDDQELDNPKASHKPGEASGRKTIEVKAAEEDPETANKTNPVAEATGKESKDPYAEGKHIDNPEPNNGRVEDPGTDDMLPEESDPDEPEQPKDPESSQLAPGSQPSTDER